MHTPISVACIFRYWKNGQLFLKCLTCVAVCALLKISLSISQGKGGEHSKPMGFLEMPGNIWFLLSGEEKPSPVSSLFLSWPLLCQFGHCFFILLLYSSFLSNPGKCWRKCYCTSWTLSSIWSRTSKLLKDLLILLNNFNNYMANCNSRMMINETEFLLVTELWNTLLMENVRVIVYIENNHPSSLIFTIYVLQS